MPKAAFRNVGLERWQEIRGAWTQRGDLTEQPPKKAQRLDVDGIITCVISGTTGQLPHAVALPQMIDLLIDVWEADGLFDA